MSAEWNKKLFGESDPVSRQDWEQYLNGDLSPKEQHAIEEGLTNDPFMAEAMEGFEAVPGAAAGLPALDQAFQAKTGIGSSAGSGAKAGLSAGKVWTFSAVAIIGLAAITYALWPEEEVQPDIVVVPLVDSQATATPVMNPPEFGEAISFEDLTFAEIDSAQELPENEQFRAEQVHQEQPSDVTMVEVNPVVTPVDNDSVEEVVTVDPMEGVTPTEPEPVDPVQPKHKIASNANVRWMHDLLVVDYGEARNSEIEQYRMKQEALLNDHVQAPFEDDNAQNAARLDPDIIVTKTAYNDFLDAAMEKFDKNDFKGALKDYKTILKFYPDDVNAHFYGGLCYYNIGVSKNALAWFEDVLKNNANTFHEEARWYSALVYLRKGKTKKARETLTYIVNEGGFYSDRAQTELEELGPADQ